MGKQADNPSSELNELAFLSSWIGAWSFLPYFIIIFLSWFRVDYIRSTLSQILFIVGYHWIWVFGLISIILGIVAARQIKLNQPKQTGVRLAVVGIALGIVAIVSRIVLIAIGFWMSNT